MRIAQIAMQLCFTGLLLCGCSVTMPEVPKADLTISSVSPAEFSNINNTSTLIVNYTWNIQRYDSSKKYAMQVLLYDTNQNTPLYAIAFDLNTASGSGSNAYSGAEFYTCIFGCVRKAALPFRVYFTVEQKDSASASFGTTLARSREYIYN